MHCKLLYLQLQFTAEKGYRLKSVKEGNPGKVPNMKIQLSSLHGFMDSVTFPTLMCPRMHRILPSREAHPSFGAQGFYWRLISYHSHGSASGVGTDDVRLTVSLQFLHRWN